MENKQLWPGWETVRVIGSGGFGKVYEIRKADTTGEYRAALKIISIPASPDEYESYKLDNYSDESITSLFKSQLDSIVSEFALMAQFKGVSNIVSYEDHMIVPHDDGIGWDILIRMELLTPLSIYCNLHEMGIDDVEKLANDICRALVLCEKKHIIHRDIKPQNIFVNAFGDFKLGDFGIAKTMEHTTRATKTGTYNYMAPEVYKGERYNATVDLYALGLVLYWLLNERRLPFLPIDRPPTWEENNEAQSRRLSGEAFPLPKHGTDILNAVIQKACAYNPKERYQTASEMLKALEVKSAPPLEMLSCSWCGGSGSQNILEYDLAHYSKVSCMACAGQGRLHYKHPKLLEYQELLNTPLHEKANPECEACRGLGWLVMRDSHPYPCPFCSQSPSPGGNTEGWWDGPTGFPPPQGPKEPRYYCKECGADIPKGESLCSACKEKHKIKPEPGPTPDTIVCPRCLGTKVQTFVTGGFSYKYWDDTCEVCHGAGKISNDEAGSLLRSSYESLRRAAKAEGIISADCPVCHGLGQVIEVTHGPVFRTQRQIKCPKCFGRKVKKIERSR